MSIAKPITTRFDQLIDQIAAAQIPGGAVKSHGLVVVAAANSPAALKSQANYVCDGTADEVEIQAAIDAVYALGGGTVFLLQGLFTLAASLKAKSGVMLRGVRPLMTMTASHPDMGWNFTGGTILTGPGLTLITADGPVLGAGFEDFAFQNCDYGIRIGGTGAWGLALSTIQNLYGKNIAVCGIELVNFQRVYVKHIQLLNAAQGYHFKGDYEDRSPGNSEFHDLYVHSTTTAATTTGLICIEATSNSALAHLIFTRLQGNQYATRSGPVMKIAGPIIGCNIYGLDLERFSGDNNDVLNLAAVVGVSPNRLFLVVTEAKKIKIEESTNITLVCCYELAALYVDEDSCTQTSLQGCIGSFQANSHKPLGFYTVAGTPVMVVGTNLVAGDPGVDGQVYLDGNDLCVSGI